MPLSIDHLPPAPSIYDYPMVYPGQEPNEQQQQQMRMAQIAGIVAGVGAAKVAIMDTISIQLAALLRASDLTTEAGIAAFSKAAAQIVKIGIARAKDLAWGGVAARAQLVGIPFPSESPVDNEIPPEYRYSRSTPLEKAYARLADEYQEQMRKTKDDPVIADLIRQYEEQGRSPLPRPSDLSSDAIRRPTNGEEGWQKAFREAQEEQREITRRAIAREESRSEEREARDAEARERAEAQRALREARASAEDRDSDSEGGSRSSSGTSEDGGSRSGSGDERDEKLEEFRLTDLEIHTVIERYAEQKVEERAQRMVESDIQTTYRNTHANAMRKVPKTVLGYRRVVHPELNASGTSCGLCIVASTMVYSRSDLLPIHASCKCEVVEIYEISGELFDPGKQINEEDLRAFYHEAGQSTHGWDLKRQKYKVIDHPEYGPTLVNANEKKATENIPFEGRRVSVE